MATKVDPWPLSERIDWHLNEVARAWASVPDDAAEWDTWDEESQMIYRYHWTIPREQWAALEEWAAEDLLTAEQLCRFHEIEELMRAHSATLARLFGSDDPEQPFLTSQSDSSVR
jgi:hypothetical protein